jgi:hypothetical protein
MNEVAWARRHGRLKRRPLLVVRHQRGTRHEPGDMERLPTRSAASAERYERGGMDVLTLNHHWLLKVPKRKIRLQSI